MSDERAPESELVEADSGLDAHRFAHPAMATVFEVVCSHEDRAYAGQGARAVFELVDELEGQLSRFIANSDVSRVNALGPGESTRVSPWTMECLEIARRMYVLTRRAFDISLGSGLEHLELRPGDFVVRVAGEGIRLDLGGIGKGYAIDRAAELLDDWGIQHALLHGGFSSVRARDAPPGRDGWPLTLTAPRSGEDPDQIRISARRVALSASGTRKGTHIRDPRTGRPVDGGAAWAILPCCSESDLPPAGEWVDVVHSPAAVVEALSTAFMILTPGEVEELCQEGPGPEAWLFRGTPGVLRHLGPGREGA